MEFGIGMFGDLTEREDGNFQPVSNRLQELITQVQLADRLGYHNFTLGEHHRPEYAVSVPEIVLAALATATEKIHLVSGVTVLSSADPVKVFQEFTTINAISNGRAEIIAGRGSFTESFPVYGYSLEDYEALFEEKLALLNQLNQTETIDWEGKFRAPLQHQTIYPRAEFELPIWRAVGGTPSSIHQAAKQGLPIIFAIIGGEFAKFEPLINYYKTIYLESGFAESDMKIGVHAHCFVADSVEEIEQDYFPKYAAQMNRIGKQRGWAPYSLHAFRAGMSEQGALAIGTPKQVQEKVSKMINLFGLTRFVGHMDVGGPTNEQLQKSIKLFADYNIPLTSSIDV